MPPLWGVNVSLPQEVAAFPSPSARIGCWQASAPTLALDRFGLLITFHQSHSCECLYTDKFLLFYAKVSLPSVHNDNFKFCIPAAQMQTAFAVHSLLVVAMHNKKKTMGSTPVGGKKLSPSLASTSVLIRTKNPPGLFLWLVGNPSDKSPHRYIISLFSHVLICVNTD